MTNTALLKNAIKKSGLKRQYIASQLGITRQALWNRENGKAEFKQNEINKLCALLGISDLKDKEAIFNA